MRYAGIITTIIVLFSTTIFAQPTKPLTQTIRGVVTDKISGQPTDRITVRLLDSPLGTSTDKHGSFIIENVPLGRYTIVLSGVGYETAVINEILVSSAKETYMEINITQNHKLLDEIQVRKKTNKSQPLNKMALIGAQMFSVEEASRFAGGMDDPARLVSNYAGVATQSISNNGISIRGNAPSLLQWKLEGVEIPNPNHFADISVIGGGFLSALSGNVLGNSDFFIGAFPAEYNNAVSGVFDMKLRNGNNRKYQHAFQLGVLGIDLASEGPINRENNSSYIINYRYSTTSLVEKIKNKKDLGGQLSYQDLNFKFNFPTKKSGTFSLWGVGLIDGVKPKLQETKERKYLDDGILSSATQRSAALGLSHRYLLDNHKTSLTTSLATTHVGHIIGEEYRDLSQQTSPRTDLLSRTTNLIFTTALNHKFNAMHNNKTGIVLTNINYDMNLDFTPFYGQELQNYIHTKGQTNLIVAYTNSLIQINPFIALNAGVNMQHLTLNGSTSIEPRVAVKWQASTKHNFSIGYGLHSRMEKSEVYFVRDNQGKMVNKNLGFTKSNHILLSYDYSISEDMNLKIEPYMQFLFDVPVKQGSAYAIPNHRTFYIKEPLVASGKAKNYGIDITFSKYITKGLYYMLTTSLFESKYSGGDGLWYNTKYNRNWIINGLIGKEWMLNNNMLSINLKASTMGGQRYTPIDEKATMEHPDKEVQYDDKNTYTKQLAPMFVGDFTFSYKMNREKTAHTFSVKSVNATRQKDYIMHKYNIITKDIEPFYTTNSLFNISYRIDF